MQVRELKKKKNLSSFANPCFASLICMFPRNGFLPENAEFDLEGDTLVVPFSRLKGICPP